MIYLFSRFSATRAGILFLPILLLAIGCRTDPGAGVIETGRQRGQTAVPQSAIQREDELAVADGLESNHETGTEGMAKPTLEQATIEPDSSEVASGTANADVEHVRAIQLPDGRWTFYVTVRHPDTGWDDYADGWDVITPDGLVLKRDPADPFTRLLLHPHKDEQPFTRSQSGLVVPEGTNRVTVRAHDLLEGFGGRSIMVDLVASSGPGFEVERR